MSSYSRSWGVWLQEILWKIHVQGNDPKSLNFIVLGSSISIRNSSSEPGLDELTSHIVSLSHLPPILWIYTHIIALLNPCSLGIRWTIYHRNLSNIIILYEEIRKLINREKKAILLVRFLPLDTPLQNSYSKHKVITRLNTLIPGYKLFARIKYVIILFI